MKSKTATLSRKMFGKLEQAVAKHYGTLCARRQYEEARVLKFFLQTLPRHAPYTVTIQSNEWPIISRAIRAHDLSIYQTLIKPQYFFGLRALSVRTQRKHDKWLAAATRRATANPPLDDTLDEMVDLIVNSSINSQHEE